MASGGHALGEGLGHVARRDVEARLPARPPVTDDMSQSRAAEASPAARCCVRHALTPQVRAVSRA